jgi:hypothetical protein
MQPTNNVTLNKAGSFVATGRVHVHKDGRPFYVFDHAAGATFTLPEGSYHVQGGYLVGPMKKRRGHKTPSRLRFPMPKTVRLEWCSNPNKCSISLKDGVILADHSLKALPAFALVYILFHEIGHYWYADEVSCDKYAADEMHRRGYNPSQIYAATQLTMDNEHRRACNTETARKLSAQ